MDTIFIIGAGAIGKALAVFLKLQNREVVLLRGSADNIVPHLETIDVLMADGTALSSGIKISSLSNYKKLDGIIVITTKSFGNPRLALELKSKTISSPIVVLQNGLNVEHAFLEHFENVYRCVLFATSQVLSANSIRFKPVSISPIGTLKGSALEVDSIVQALDSPNFQFKSVSNIQEIIWRKVIANCVFNSICPLLDIDNGIFHRDADALALGKVVIEECVAIATACGIALRSEEIIETVLMISKSSDGQLISTLQDIKNGRETEIESLNFAVVKLAERTNNLQFVPTTKALGELVKLKAKR